MVNPPGGGKRTRCLNSDVISTLPQNIIESILNLTPLRDAVRTSVLSKKWRYSWRCMPELVFTDDMVEIPSNRECWQLNKYKLANAIFQVLLLHNGPTIVDFDISVGYYNMKSEFAQIISYLAKRNCVKDFTFINDESFYKLSLSFFSLQGLECILLQNCVFEPPPLYSKFSCLKCITFASVDVSAKTLQGFLSNCPLVEHIRLLYYQESIDFVPVGNKFTFVDLLQCVPLIQLLGISQYYMKYLCVGGMPHKLPTSLYLEYLDMEVCLMEQNQISSALCLIRSSPLLERMTIKMHDNESLPVRKTPTNFLDLEYFPDLKLNLVTLKIEKFSNLPFEMEFVKLIMAKSPALKRARIELDADVSVDEELKILRDLVLLPFRASPFAKLTIVHPETSDAS